MPFAATLSSSSHHLCYPNDSLSLLQFKAEMLHLNTSTDASDDCDYSGQYSYPKMISWNKEASPDCCTWDGVTCHGITGHVISLDLSCSRLMGVFHQNSSLFGLSRLQKLNLAFNSFNLSKIPTNIRGLSNLIHLNLSKASFGGVVPPKLSHLSKLVLLDLSRNYFLKFHSGDFQILLSNLTNIRVLSLDSVDISTTMPTNWSSTLTNLSLESAGLHGLLLNSIFHLPRLQTLILSGNINLSITIPESNISTTSPLQVLDLSFTNFSSNGITDFISFFTSLRSLIVVGCGLSGSVPNSIGNLSQIIQLIFLDNSFTGQFPSHIIENLTELQTLSLAMNSLSGPLPANMSGLRKLVMLDLSENAFNSTIPIWLLSSPSLEYLHLDHNSFTGQIKEFITKSFVCINFSSNQLDGPIPHSISQLVNLSYFDFSSNNLSGSIDPNWPLLNSLMYLNLSYNSLSSLGSSNSLPLMKNLVTLDLRSNNFHEPLPHFICNFELLYILDLSHNNFTGSIPKCFGNFSQTLEVLNLAKNDLKGAISVTFSKDNRLLNLNLNGNSLEGALPTSLANCKYMQVLDVGNNKINDTFPTFLENLNELQVLILKSNRFFGTISNFRNENFLPQLRVFDLSDNKFTGALPVELLKSFKAMVTLDKIESKASYMGIFPMRSQMYHYSMCFVANGLLFPMSGQMFHYSMPMSSQMYHYSMGFVVKGLLVEFTQILTTLVVIDLSSNCFKGDIPNIIGNLSSLIVLNLSHNYFSGQIPSTFGKLHYLESLDLSWNQIEGEIPPQLAELTNLEFLNVSQNHLVGRIPRGNQFNTFMNESYYGNLGLCGFPVTEKCEGMGLPSPPSECSYQGGEKSKFFIGFTWKLVLIGYGFGTVFGFAIGCLVFFTSKQNWLVRNIEEAFLYGLLLLGKKQMCEQLIKTARRRGQKYNRRKYWHSHHNKGDKPMETLGNILGCANS